MPTSQTVDLPPESPPLAVRVLLLDIERARANWEGNTAKAKELGERMLEEVKRAAGLFEPSE